MNITKNITKQPKAVTVVEVTVPWSDISPKWDETLNKLAADVEIPGFRKGAAPLDMVEGKISQQLQQQFLQDVMPQALMEALTGSDIVPIDYPQYQVMSFTKGSDLKFSATLTERPTIKVGEYKGIKASKSSPRAVTDEQIEKIVTDLFNRWKVRQPQNQPQPNQGGSGSMSFNQAGGDTPTTVTPQTSTEPDDVFAKGVGAESLVDLKQKIRADLEAESKNEAEMDYEEAVLAEVEKITSVEIPDILIQDELNRMLVSLQRRVTETGMLMEDYLKSQNKTLESIKAEWRPQAEKNMRMELGLSEIARMENVAISDEELQAEIDKIQDARLKAQFANQEPRMHLRHALRQTKTLQLLKSLVS